MAVILRDGPDASTGLAPRAPTRARARTRAWPRDALENLGVDVEVRVDRVDVVLVLERVDQPHQLGGAVLVERRRASSAAGRPRSVSSSIPACVERGAHGGQVGRLAEHLEDVVVERDVVAPASIATHQVVLAVALARRPR